MLFNTTVPATPSTLNVTLSGERRTCVDLPELTECSPFQPSVLS